MELLLLQQGLSENFYKDLKMSKIEKLAALGQSLWLDFYQSGLYLWRQTSRYD